MIVHRSRISLSFASVFALALWFGAGLTAQDEPATEKPKEPSPEVTEQIGKLSEAIKDRKAERDADAIGMIDELLAKYETLHEDNQQEFVETLSDVFFRSKKRDPEEAAIYTAAAAALGKAGGEPAAKILAKAYEWKHISKRDEWAAVQDQILEGIGQTKDEKHVKFLLDEATRSPHDGVKAAAGKALRHFEEASFKVRKEIVKEIVQEFDRVWNAASDNLNQDPAVEKAKRTRRAIADTWNQTLAKLTGENIEEAPLWRQWWNDHKSSPKKWKHQTETE